MKTVLKRILVIAVMLGTFTSYGNVYSEVIPNLDIINKGDLVSVYNAQGNIVYSDRVEYDGTLRTMFDFRNLKDGIYTIEINKDFEIAVNTFKVNDKMVTFVEGAQKTIYKPVFRTKESKVLISKLALDSSKMEIKLYFKSDLIYSEKVTGTGIINRVYKLDETEHGEYTAVIRANGRVYIENFKL